LAIRRNHFIAGLIELPRKRASPVQCAPNFLLRSRRSYWSYAKDWLSELLLRRSKPGKDFRGRFVVEAKFFGSVGALKCIGRHASADNVSETSV
jgi:hypothetical protein